MSRRILAAVILLPLAGAASAWNSAASAPDDPSAPAPSLPKNDWSRSKAFVERSPARARRLAGAKTEGAVLAALDWLERHQLPDGGWSSDKVLTCCADPKAPCRNRDTGQVTDGNGMAGFDVGVTALAILAFAARGNTYLEAEKPEYRAAIDRAVSALLLRAEKEGDHAGALGKSPECEEWLYNHCIATIALAEQLIGTGDRQRLAAPVAAAADLLIAGQARKPAEPPGSEPLRLGWHYVLDRKMASDTSVTGWATQALWTVGQAREADLVATDPRALALAFEGVTRWLESVCSEKGVIGYASPGDAGAVLGQLFERGFTFSKELYPTMTASGCFSWLLTGAEETDRIALAWELLCDREPRFASSDTSSKRTSPVNYYAWYFISHAWVRKGGAQQRRWKTALEKVLCDAQREGGCEAGSWDTVGEWCSMGGRAYSTAMAALSLQAPYRLDPPKR